MLQQTVTMLLKQPIGAAFFLSLWLFCFHIKTDGASSDSDDFDIGDLYDSETKPNIIFILVDDLGRGDVGFLHDNDEIDSSNVLHYTPTMDKLAREMGMILERHYTNSVCTPTRASFLTGKYPSSMGFEPQNPFTGAPVLVQFETRSLAKTEILFPSLLRKYGNYATVMGGKWHVGISNWDVSPLSIFDEATYSSLGYISAYQHSYCIPPSMFGIAPGFVDCSQELQSSILSKYPAPDGLCLYDMWNGIDSTVENIETYNNDVWAEDIYYQQIESFITRFVSDRESESISQDTDEVDSNNIFEGKDAFFAYYAPYTPHWPIEDAPNTIDYSDCDNIENEGRYLQCKMVIYLDSLIEKLVNKLIELNIWDNTLIVVTSDNGANVATDPNNYQNGFGNGFSQSLPLRGTKFSRFEGGIRGTSFITGGYLPSRLYGTKYDGLIGIQDWFITFLNLAQIDSNEMEEFETIDNFYSYDQWPSIVSCDQSLSNQIESERMEWVEFFLDGASWIIIRNDGWKFIKQGADDIYAPQTKYYNYVNFDGTQAIVDFEYDDYQDEMLFNVFTDPYESTNLINQYPLIAQELENALAVYQAQRIDYTVEFKLGSVKASAETKTIYPFQSREEYVDINDTAQEIWSLFL